MCGSLCVCFCGLPVWPEIACEQYEGKGELSWSAKYGLPGIRTLIVTVEFASVKGCLCVFALRYQLNFSFAGIVFSLTFSNTDIVFVFTLRYELNFVYCLDY